MSDGKYVFHAGTKVADFVSASNPVDIIQGPIGSGKTQAMCLRIVRHAQEQVQSPRDGVRRSKFFMVRNTMPDLRRHTIPTWLRVCPESIYGKFNYGADMHHDLNYTRNGVRIECRVHFFSLDREEDVRKLRGGEFTGGAFNELSFLMVKELFIEAASRLRYPEPEHGGPNPWRGLMGDTNAPDEDHWLAMMTGQVEAPIGISPDEQKKYEWPESWKFYRQPAALIEKRDQRGLIVGYNINPAAENLGNLPKNYYEEQLVGKPSKAWIDSRLMNVVAMVVEGNPVWPMFRREFHVASEALKPVPNHDVIVSLDFGRVYPAALFGQEINGRIYWQYEILGFNEPASVFAPRVQKFLTQHYPGYNARFVGDPKGRDKGQQTEQSSYDIFAAHGMPVRPAPVKMNDIETRTEAVAYALNDNPAGIPRIQISPVCRTLIVGMSGRYHLVREETGELKPKKDKYSNLCDCAQYFVLDRGDGRRMIGLAPIGLVAPARIATRHKTMRRVIG